MRRAVSSADGIDDRDENGVGEEGLKSIISFESESEPASLRFDYLLGVIRHSRVWFSKLIESRLNGS